eukprot:SM000078S22114  [mRNA]  locus=s78:474849:478058:+ [translate_table: standard]
MERTDADLAKAAAEQLGHLTMSSPPQAGPIQTLPGPSGGQKEFTPEDGPRLHEEIARLSNQVIKLVEEKTALEQHDRWLANMLATVRAEAAAHHIDPRALGVNLERSFSIHSQATTAVKTEKSQAAVTGQAQLEKVRELGKLQGWVIESTEVQLFELVGSGSTAEIYRGDWHGMDVAVKILKPEHFDTDPAALGSFCLEVELLSKQRHPWVLRLLGAVLNPPQQCWLVTELVKTGTLAEWLHGSKQREWKRKSPLPPLDARMRIALEVSQALQYLHEERPVVIHRDLKPSNVFLDDAKHIRLADFGFARYYTPADSIMTGETGTYMYMAPEVVKHESYTEKCDVYSFGVLLCELLTGDPPYIDTYLSPVQIAVAVADGKLRPKLPSSHDHHIPHALVELLPLAWHQDASQRPPFSKITQTIKAAMQSSAGTTGHQGFFHQLLSS